MFASARHPLAQTDGIAFEQLEGHIIIMKEEGSSTQALVRRCFDRHSLTPNVLLETSNLEFIKGMVEKGEGVSFLVRSAIAKEIDEGRIAVIPIRDQELFFQVHIAYLEAGDLSPAAQAFLRILEEERERFSAKERTRAGTL